MNPQIDIAPISTAEVAAAARARMKENDNYRRTALMLGLMQLLVQAPTLIMYLVFTRNLEGASAQDILTINSRLMLFQAMIALLLTPALLLSKSRFMLSAMRGRAGSPMELFDGLGKGSYFVSVRAMLWQMAVMYMWIMMPASIMGSGMLTYMTVPPNGLVPLLVGAGLLLVIMVNRSLAYSQQFYFLADMPRLGAIMSLNLSKAAMHRRVWELLRLELRLLPYLLPGYLPVIASMVFLRDSTAFWLLMQLAAIALTALCAPVAEAAHAEYFLRVQGEARKLATELQRRQAGAWEGQDDDSDDPDDSGEGNEGPQGGGDDKRF